MEISRTDIDYHTNRDEIKSLAFIKDVFGRPVADVPQIVGIAVATPALRYFYTTNIDEILCQAALGKAVAVYPDYKPMTAQFVYLHGRASTAKSVHEHLVLGNEGYRRAYEDAVGVSPIAKLRQLAPYPTIFLGFSMTDTAVMRTLREMAQAAKRPQEGSSGGQAVELAPQLNWYVALPAPPARDPGRIEEKRRTELSLRNAGRQGDLVPRWRARSAPSLTVSSATAEAREQGDHRGGQGGTGIRREPGGS